MYVGLDIHKKYCYGAVMDEEGQVLSEGKFLNNREDLDQFLTELTPQSQIAMEACGFWEPMYDQIEEQGFEVTLAHPLKTRAIAEARIKTDKIDAQTLAHLLRANLLPESYVPDADTRCLRHIVRHRATLVKVQTSLKNQIHALLAQTGIQHAYTDLFGKAGKQFLEQLELGEVRSLALHNYLDVLDLIQTKIKETNRFMSDWVKGRKDVELLESMPGVGTYSAVLILGEIGNIDRFRNDKKLCSYAGVVPSVYQSGNTHRYGHITKAGSAWLRWVLVQAVLSAIQKPNILQRFYQRIAKKRGKKIAVIATARKMLCYIYQMLKWEVSFQQLKVNQARAPR